MKKLFLFLFVAVFSVISAIGQTQQDNFSPLNTQRLYINGSEAMFPVLAEMVTKFNYQYQFGGHKNVNLEVKNQLQGSTMGLESLLEGHSNLATSTRPMTQQEKDEFKRSNLAVKEFVVAREALTVVVNSRASVYALTAEQISGIFSGKITNWLEVGGEDLKIKVFIRSNTSGCYQGFKDMFFKNGEDYSPTALQLSSNAQIKQNLEKFDGAISFLGYNSAAIKESSVRMLKISTDKGLTFIEPNQMSIDNGTYSLVRKCYVYCLETDYQNRVQIKEFIDFLMSSKNGEIWEENGFWQIVKK